MRLYDENNGFPLNILFLDEVTFYINVVVHRQNYGLWSSENPFWIYEAHTRSPQKINLFGVPGSAGIFLLILFIRR